MNIADMNKKGRVFSGRLWLAVFIFFCVAALLPSRDASAIPSADFLYSETNVSAGLWQYDYTLYNTGDPVADAGYNIYDVFMPVSGASLFSTLSTPAGWVDFSGPGFIELFSDPWGFPPGEDILPGTSLAGFSFLMDYRLGDTAFMVYMTNPDDPFSPAIYDGGTSARPATVPEPGSALLVTSGLFLLTGYLLLGRRRAGSTTR